MVKKMGLGYIKDRWQYILLSCFLIVFSFASFGKAGLIFCTLVGLLFLISISIGKSLSIDYISAFILVLYFLSTSAYIFGLLNFNLTWSIILSGLCLLVIAVIVRLFAYGRLVNELQNM